MADPTVVSSAEAALALDVDARIGLSADEARRRLERDGSNTMPSAAGVPLWRRIGSQFNDPLVYLLVAAVAVSTTAWALDGAAGLPVDSLVIAAVILLNATLGFIQESRASAAVAALADMTAAMSTVLRSGTTLRVPSADLVVGDVLVLAEGDAVGADARLLNASALRIAEASLTGESESTPKQTTALTSRPALADRSNMVHQGTAVTQGSGRAVVTAVGLATELGAIAGLLGATPERPTPLDREIGRLGRLLGALVVTIAVIVVITIVVVDGVREPADLVLVLLLGVSLAVAAVPEGLPSILSVVLAIGVQRLAKRNAVVKKLSAVEALGSTSVICTDKTGTLTRGQMAIETIVTASGRAEVSGVGYEPRGEVTRGGHVLTGAALLEAQVLLTAGSLAGDAKVVRADGVWSVIGDPTEASFVVAAGKLPGTAAAMAGYRRQATIPFTSERKMMSAVTTSTFSEGTVVFSKGAPDVLLALCTRELVGGWSEPLSTARRAAALAAVDELTGRALRVMAVAYRAVDTVEGVTPRDVEKDLVLVGVVGIIDPPRPEVAEAIREAQRAGLRIVMITGDHPRTARRIADDLGIGSDDGDVVTGFELDSLDDVGMRRLAQGTSVYARVAPAHKLRLVAALQAEGEVVAMTGDGVNDAPALKAADIGVAMGIAGTDVSQQAARIVLADDDFATIIAAVRQGRIVFDNIRKFLRYLLASNTGEVLTVFLGVVFAGALGLTGASAETVVLPLLATQILWMNLLTDTGPALALGMDPEVDDVMSRPPRAAGAHAIDGGMWAGVLILGTATATSALFAIDLFLPAGFVPGTDTLEVARTAGFTTLVFSSFFTALASRSETTTVFRTLRGNPWLWGSIALGVALQIAVVEVPFLQVAFGTASLDLGHWLACVLLGSVVLWVDELRKSVLRLRSRRAFRLGGCRPLSSVARATLL